MSNLKFCQTQIQFLGVRCGGDVDGPKFLHRECGSISFRRHVPNGGLSFEMFVAPDGLWLGPFLHKGCKVVRSNSPFPSLAGILERVISPHLLFAYALVYISWSRKGKWSAWLKNPY